MLRELFFTTAQLTLSLNLSYITSSDNPADLRSRRHSVLDSRLTDGVWRTVQDPFGGDEGHTCDLMALDLNVMQDKSGKALPHFTPPPSPAKRKPRFQFNASSSRAIRHTTKPLFFSGDRPGDLGQVRVPEILRFPNDDGFLFSHIWGKTLRDGDQNVFGIRRHPDAMICQTKAIEQYVQVAPNGGIQDTPFSTAAAEARLHEAIFKRYGR